MTAWPRFPGWPAIQLLFSRPQFCRAFDSLTREERPIFRWHSPCWPVETHADASTTTGAAMLVADAIFAFQQGLHAAWRARYPQLSAIVIGALDAGAQRAAEGLRTIYLPRPVDGSTLLCMVSMVLTA